MAKADSSKAWSCLGQTAAGKQSVTHCHRTGCCHRVRWSNGGVSIKGRHRVMITGGEKCASQHRRSTLPHELCRRPRRQPALFPLELGLTKNDPSDQYSYCKSQRSCPHGGNGHVDRHGRRVTSHSSATSALTQFPPAFRPWNNIIRTVPPAAHRGFFAKARIGDKSRA